MHLRHSLPFESKVSKARFENGTLKCFFAVVVKNEVNDGIKPCEATHSQWAALCCRGTARGTSRKPPGEGTFLSAFGT